MRGRATGGAWGGGGGASSMRREAPTAERLLWEGMRGAHMKHFVHGCDVGRVPAQRLVKRTRDLPSKKGRMWEEGGNMRGRARGGVWGGGGGASSQGGPPTAEVAVGGHAWSAQETWCAWS